MHFGDGADRTGNRQLFTVLDGWEVYIDLYADGDLDEALVRDQNALASSLRTASAASPWQPPASASSASSSCSPCRSRCACSSPGGAGTGNRRGERAFLL